MASVILTSRTFRDLAEPMLYRHIDLSNCPIRSVYLLRTLYSRHALCQYVRTFLIADYYWRCEKDLFSLILKNEDPGPKHESFDQHIQIIFGKLTAVEILSLPVLQDGLHPNLNEFTQLRRLRTRHTLHREHIHLLDDMPRITHLEIPYSSLASLDEPRSARLAQLEELVATTNLAVQLVPDRPVRRLIMRWSIVRLPESPYALLEKVALSTKPIRTLGLLMDWEWNWQRGAEWTLNAIVTFLPHIEELVLRLYCDKSNSSVLLTMLDQVGCSVT
ncbi:hypothetical protein FRC00_009442, partial [Tulasnella sp. 408]